MRPDALDFSFASILSFVHFGSQFAKHFHRHSDAAAGRRDGEGTDVSRVIGDLRCFTAAELQAPHLRRARTASTGSR